MHVLDCDFGTDLGKYDGGGYNCYIEKAKSEEAMYFNMGELWGDTKNKYRLTDHQMFDAFNIPVLDYAIESGKTIKFSHDPRKETIDSSLLKEWRHLESKGYIDLEPKGGFWYAVK